MPPGAPGRTLACPGAARAARRRGPRLRLRTSRLRGRAHRAAGAAPACDRSPRPAVLERGDGRSGSRRPIKGHSDCKTLLAAIAEEADRRILLDVNNACVNAHNHGFDARTFLDAVPAERVVEIHLAGHAESGPLRIDTHDRAVGDEVWSLYAHALKRRSARTPSTTW